MIYPNKPESDEVLRIVEEILYADGIQVAWQDESMEELRKRNVTKGNS